MPTVTGKDKVDALFTKARKALETKILRGAARAAAEVIAEEIKVRSESKIVADALVISTKLKNDRMVATVAVKGEWPNAVGNWQEWGTSPHFITVDESQREGRTVTRINALHKAGSLAIGGKFVGATVFHPGARPSPAFRPALDTKAGEAVEAAQAYIDKNLRKIMSRSTVDSKDDE